MANDGYVKRSRTVLRLAGCLLLLGSVGCGSTDQRPLIELGPQGATTDDSAISVHRAEVDLSQLAAHGISVDLELFTGARETVQLSYTAPSARAHLWHGAGRDGTQVRLARVGDRVAGTFRTADGRLLQLLPQANGHDLIERDESAIPAGEDAIAVPQPSGASLPQQGDAAVPIETDEGEFHTPATAGELVTIDLVVAYTEMAAAYASQPNSGMGVEAIAWLAVAEANEAFANSAVGIELSIAAFVSVDYHEEDKLDWELTLDHLRRDGDGHMDEVHQIRDEVGGDHVVLLVDASGPYAGMAYQRMPEYDAFFDAYAFAVVARDYAAGALTFAHEIGHNLGAGHDHDNASFAYSEDAFGYRDPHAGFRTVMAYPCEGCPRIPVFSNPDVIYEGEPVGVVGWADNARTLQETRYLSAAHREAAAAPPPPPGYAATIASPETGARLEATAVTFAWKDSGADNYRLQLGTLVDPDRYFSGETHGTSIFVPGLPSDGTGIMAVLSSHGPDGWLTRTAAYEAYTAPASTASLVYPPAWSEIQAPAFLRWTYGSNEHVVVVRDQLGEIMQIHELGDTNSLKLVDLDAVSGDTVAITLYSLVSAQAWGEHTVIYRLP